MLNYQGVCVLFVTFPCPVCVISDGQVSVSMAEYLWDPSHGLTGPTYHVVNPINHPQVITRYKPSPMVGLWHWVAHICSNWNSIVLGLRRSRWRSLLKSGLQSEITRVFLATFFLSVINSHKSPFSTYPWGHKTALKTRKCLASKKGLWNRQALGTKRKSWGAFVEWICGNPRESCCG